jgi:hypothetical protein
MGPGDGIQIQRLMDLPTTLETADQSPQQPAHVLHHKSFSPLASSAASAGPQQNVQRVKSMFQQSSSTAKVGQVASNARGMSAHPPPPQRSISHNEVSWHHRAQRTCSS